MFYFTEREDYVTFNNKGNNIQLLEILDLEQDIDYLIS